MSQVMAGAPFFCGQSNAFRQELREWQVLGLLRSEGDDEQFRPCHYLYVYNIESRLMMRVRYESHVDTQSFWGWGSAFGCVRDMGRVLGDRALGLGSGLVLG